MGIKTKENTEVLNKARCASVADTGEKLKERIH